jgi:hypothetical protein
MAQLDLPAAPKRFICREGPVGFLAEDGKVYDLEGRSSQAVWNEVVAIDRGAVHAFRGELITQGPAEFVVNEGLFHFESFDALLTNKAPKPLTHPLLNLSCLELHATETRAFVLCGGAMQILLEIVTVDGHKPCPPRLEPVQGLEGMGIASIIPGSSNRLGVVTDAGEAWLLGRRGPPELLRVEGDVQLLGIGSAFEIAVTETSVFVRGNSECTSKLR